MPELYHPYIIDKLIVWMENWKSRL